MIRLWVMLLSAGVLLAGCSKAPEALANLPPEKVEALQRHPPEASTTPFPNSRDQLTTIEASPAPTATALFAHSETVQAVQEYATAVTELHNYGQHTALPDAKTIYQNPSSAAGYLNGVGVSLRKLKEAREKVEVSLAPGEEARWEAYRKSVEHLSE
jgi:hypothetical protein